MCLSFCTPDVGDRPESRNKDRKLHVVGNTVDFYVDLHISALDLSIAQARPT